MTKPREATAMGYREVRDTVLERIRSGPWPSGTLIPAEADLALEFGVSRATVNRALQELSAKGYIERRRKGGTRVRPRPERAAKFAIPLIREEIEAMGAAYGYKLISRSIETGPAETCKHLGVPKTSKLLHLTCLHSADSLPLQFEDRWINPSTLPEVLQADLTTLGPNEWLVARVPFTDVDMEIGAENPSGPIARLLRSPKNAPSLTIRRTTWLGEKSVTHVTFYFRSGYCLRTNY